LNGAVVATDGSTEYYVGSCNTDAFVIGTKSKAGNLDATESYDFTL